jgi:4-hydroxy-tetrahydrodipicolinate reductase
LKIALIGYGKMGKAIEAIAMEQGHEIVLRINSKNNADLNPDNLKKADIAIEFTHPGSAVANIRKCIENGLPVVCGTTGWLQYMDEVVSFCKEHDGALLVASNFSIGVNIFFEINRILAKLMAKRKEYDVSVEETHHTQKKDAPSGTAISIAEDILREIGSKSKWVKENSGNKEELMITSKRVDPAPGTHIVTYDSAIDSIEIKHTAHNRTGFATGAVMAAAFLAGKKGVYTMEDVLKSSS